MTLRFTKRDIDVICEVISDDMANWYLNNDLTMTEQVFAETIEKIIIQSLRLDLKEIER